MTKKQVKYRVYEVTSPDGKKYRRRVNRHFDNALFGLPKGRETGWVTIMWSGTRNRSVKWMAELIDGWYVGDAFKEFRICKARIISRATRVAEQYQEDTSFRRYLRKTMRKRRKWTGQVPEEAA